MFKRTNITSSKSNPKITLTHLKFESTHQSSGSFRLSAIYKNNEIAHALYKECFNGGLFLNWIETTEQFQHNGVASLLLNHICMLAKEKKTYLEINVVDEQLLNDFYLKWFQNTFDPEHTSTDKIIAKFNDIILEGDLHPSIKFSLEDLSWQPSLKKTLT